MNLMTSHGARATVLATIMIVSMVAIGATGGAGAASPASQSHLGAQDSLSASGPTAWSYVNDNAVVETDGLLNAITDFRSGDLSAETLTQVVLPSFRSGAPIASYGFSDQLTTGDNVTVTTLQAPASDGAETDHLVLFGPTGSIVESVQLQSLGNVSNTASLGLSSATFTGLGLLADGTYTTRIHADDGSGSPDPDAPRPTTERTAQVTTTDEDGVSLSFRLNNGEATDDPRVEGETLTAYAAVENFDNESHDRTIEYRVDGSTIETRSVSLDPGEYRNLLFTYETEDGDAPEVTPALFFGTDKQAETTARIREDSRMVVNIEDVTDPVNVTSNPGGAGGASSSAVTPASNGPGQDVMITLDTSGSMDGDKIDNATDGAKALVGSLGEDVDVGLTWFNDSATVEAPIGTSRSEINNSIDSLSADSTTNMSGGINVSQQELEANGTAGGEDNFMIVLADGGADDDSATRASARDARNVTDLNNTGDNTTIVSIAYGSGADEELMEDIASPPKNDDDTIDDQDENAYLGGTDDITQIFQDIGSGISDPGADFLTRELTADIQVSNIGQGSATITRDITLSVDGQVTDTQTVTLQDGDTTRIELSGAGTGVNGDNTTVEAAVDTANGDSSARLVDLRGPVFNVDSGESYPEIQPAINDANEGDTVLVYGAPDSNNGGGTAVSNGEFSTLSFDQPGYFEGGVVVNKTGLTLQGIDEPYINVSGGGSGFDVQNDSVTIDGFGYGTQGGNGGASDTTGALISNGTSGTLVSNNDFDSLTIGVAINESADATIQSNSFVADAGTTASYVTDNTGNLDLEAIRDNNTFDPNRVIGDNQIVPVDSLNPEFTYTSVVPGENQENPLNVTVNSTAGGPVAGAEVTLTVQKGDGELEVGGDTEGNETTVETGTDGDFVDPVVYVQGENDTANDEIEVLAEAGDVDEESATYEVAD